MAVKLIIVTLVAIFFVSGAGPARSQQETAAPDSAEVQPPTSAPSSAPSTGGRLPDDVPGLQQAAVDAYQAGNYQRFTQATMLLRKQRPFEPRYMIGMVAGAAQIGRPNTAYRYMHMMQQQGLSYDFNSTDDTASIRATEVYSYLNDLLIRAGQPAGEGQVVVTLPESRSYPEAIAWDSSRGKLLVGSIDTGAILAVTPDGAIEELLTANEDNGLWAVHGIAVDAVNDRLWVTSTGVPGFEGLQPGDLGRSALFEFKLSTLEPVGRFPVPVDGYPHLLGALGVTPSGDVFVIDRALPLIYRKAASGSDLEPYLGNSEMVGFRDLAVAKDGNRLYVADAALGILLIDLASQSAGMLAIPETLNLGGISGLMVDEDDLVVVQNGIDPQRLMRLELDPSGTTVSDVSMIAVALEPFDGPSFGAVGDGSVFYFAGSNLTGIMAGAPGDSVKPGIMRSPVLLQQQLTPVEQLKFQEEHQDKLRQGRQ